MDSRERVLAALSHKPVDRIPIDLCGHNDSCIHEIAYQRLVKYLHLPNTIPDTANVMECVVYAAEEILNLIQVDTRAVYLPIKDTIGKPQPDGSFLFTWSDGSIWKKPPGGYYFDLVIPPLQGELTSSAIASMPWPSMDDIDLIAIRDKARNLKLKTKFAVVMSGFLIMPVGGLQLWRGFEQWSIDTLAQTKLWHEMTEAYMERAFTQADKILRAVGKYIDVAYFIGDDIATQRGPWINPSFYRQHVKPFHQSAMDFIRARTEAKIIFHICGSAREFIPDLIDIGVDAINPVQTTAAGMDPLELKDEYGKDIAFWGGVDTQHVLPFGTPRDVEREVKRIISSLGPSGLVLTSCHNIQSEVPPENILTLFQSALNILIYSGLVNSWYFERTAELFD